MKTTILQWRRLDEEAWFDLKDGDYGSRTDLYEYRTLYSADPAVTRHHIIADFLERTGQYVTNDASREAALAEARSSALEEAARACESRQRSALMVLTNPKLKLNEEDKRLAESIARTHRDDAELIRALQKRPVAAQTKERA